MITLLGRWEDGWLDNRIEYFMWKQLGHAYKVDRLVMVGISDNPRVPIDQYNSIEEALTTCRGTIVLAEPKGSTSLVDFKHPEDVTYVFGNAMNHNLKHEGVTLRIDTPQNTDMFALNAAAIILASRYEHR